MKTKKILLTLTLALAAAALSFAGREMGTWKLNEAKSKFASNSPGKNNTVVYSADGDKIKVTVDGTDKAGKATHNEWTGNFDGKDYPLVGDSMADTRSYKQVDANTLELTNKKDGKLTVTGRIVMSADGKTRTVTTTSVDADGKKTENVAVYDKQ